MCPCEAEAVHSLIFIEFDKNVEISFNDLRQFDDTSSA